VKANALSKGYYQPKGWDANYLDNNYKWGLVFKMPLFLREGRGDYMKAQLKIKEATLELNTKQWQVENKIRSYSNESTMLQQQLSSIQTMFKNYQALLKNEELKFTQGESSLFMINSRETKLLEVAQKQIDLRVKYQKAKYAVEWSAGLLN
jgi:outer membrane protein TolC